MKKISVEHLEHNFNDIISLVEKGEKFIVQTYNGNVMMIPFFDDKKEYDELVKIYTEHEEGC